MIFYYCIICIRRSQQIFQGRTCESNHLSTQLIFTTSEQVKVGRYLNRFHWLLKNCRLQTRTVRFVRETFLLSSSNTFIVIIMVISMDKWKGKVAVVTGASSGIGASIAEALVGEGLQVVGVARRKDRLTSLSEKLSDKPGKFYPFTADVTSEKDILSVLEWTTKTLGPLSILVNNAGVNRPSSLLEGSTEDYKTILDTNVLAVSIACREAIKIMRVNQIDGHIININSAFGHKVVYMPNLCIYPASKHALTALTESFRVELVATGSRIKITSVSPGCTDTEIFARSNNQDILEQMKAENRCMKSEDIADAILYVLGTPSHVQIQELIIKPVGEMI